MVTPGGARHLDIKKVGDKNRVYDSIRIDRENQPTYMVEQKEVELNNEIDIKVRIYRLNTKSRNGSLEILDDENGPRTVQFEIVSGPIALYVDALKHEHSAVTAKPKMVINPFGETRLSYLFLTSILNAGPEIR